MTSNLIFLIPFGFSALLFVIFARFHFRWSKTKNSWKKVTATIAHIRKIEVQDPNSFSTRTVEINTLEYELDGNKYASQLSQRDSVFSKQTLQYNQVGDSFQI